MFRVQNNVPEVYPNQSRDFQLFCRLYDVAFNAVKKSIDSIKSISDTQKCSPALLPLLQDKLGLFLDLDVEDRVLRYVLQAFPTIIRYKGSKTAITQVLNVYSRIIGSYQVSAAAGVSIDTVNHQLLVYAETSTKYADLLVELLRYVAPAGYTVVYEQLTEEYFHQEINIHNNLEFIKLPHPTTLENISQGVINITDLVDNNEEST